MLEAGEQRAQRGAVRVGAVGVEAGAGGEGEHVHLGAAVGGAQPAFQPAAVPVEQRQYPPS